MKLKEKRPLSQKTSSTNKRTPYLLMGFIPILLLLLSFVVFQANDANAAQTGDLHIEIISGYNLVVDSNVSSPSTYAPSVATVAGKFCNTGGSTISGVQGYIGDFANTTPGIYPSRDSTTFGGEHDLLLNTGNYAYTHVGGQIGTADATRYIGDLAAGECKYQYWHFTYPQCSNTVAGAAVLPPCTTEPVWSLTNDPTDDLWLNYDIWGASADGSHTDDQTRKMTMRNEISAMANKIKPNPSGSWFNTNTNEIFPGDVITSNGILYELGNINQGFDNDGNFAPDYNAWMQPIGDPSYDPSCFRLIRTSGVLTMSLSAQPDVIIPFSDQLYFTDLPPENNGTIGEVFYTFQALNGPCTTWLTPYQEVASGYDNEKFNGDYGTGLPPIGSSAPALTLDKNGNPTAALGGTIDYVIPFVNTSGTDSSPTLPLSTGSMPLVISDTVPAGLIFNTAAANFTGYTGGYTIRYSIDSGQTWSTTAPAVNTVSNAPNALIVVQWWLNDQLPAGATGNATMQVTVPAIYDGSGDNAFVENCADISFGASVPMLEACMITVVQGPNTIGDTVWNDDGNTTGISNNGLQEGDEAGIPGIDVTLYWDKNGDGVLDSDDVFIGTQTTGAAGYYQFLTLPDGNYLVVVDKTAVLALPTMTGYSATTQETHPVANLNTTDHPGGYQDADFGFGPSLEVIKRLTSGDPSLEGQEVTYTIEVKNLRPGNGTDQPAACEYTVWSDLEAADRTGTGVNNIWSDGNNTNAFGTNELDGVFASTDYSGGSKVIIAGTNINMGNPGGTIGTAANSVEAIFQVYWDGTLTDDGAEATLWYNNVELPASAYDFSAQVQNHDEGIANIGLLVWDVTSLQTPWDWSHFTAGSDLDIVFTANKSAADDGAVLNLDAMGFRITTDQTCGGASNTLNPVPLTDVFEDAKLQFISASPSETSVVGNTVSWANIGPLYGGSTATIDLTFTALEPAGNVATTHTNTASVQNAKFLNGDPANDGSDSVTHGINPTASIGDTIWNDNGLGGGTASNGTQDGGEEGIPNVSVSLTADVDVTINGVTYIAGNVIMTDITDATGNYLFEGLPDAAYTVTVDSTTIPGTGVIQTGDPDTVCPNVTCDHQSTTTIASSIDDLTMDFGYQMPNTIYGNVWEDVDGDSTQEPGENGIPTVTVELQNGTCTPLPDGAADCLTVTTDSNGDYTFPDVPDGTYTVVIIENTLPPSTWTQTFDPEADNNGQTNPIIVSGGNVYGPYDFGYTQDGLSTIGDTIYRDWNGDGTQDSGEEGINDITVYLYKDSNGDGIIDPATDALVATTTTADHPTSSTPGDYLFSDVSVGNYIVVVNENTLPIGSYAQTGDPDQLGVTCTVCDGQSSVTGVTGITGDDHLLEDFGYQLIGSGSIGDRVWQDDDGDGIQDNGELGLSAVTVTLYEDVNNSGTYDPGVDAVVGTTVTADGTGTDPLGFYEFTGLPAGNYLVDVTTGDAPAGYVLSTANDPHPVTLTSGEAYVDADFGFTTGGVIGDFIWQDNNGDGLQDSNEPGLPGVLVELQDGTCTPTVNCQTDTTDINGLYEFTGLPAGNYTVVVDPNSDTLPTGSTQTYDPDEPNGLIPCVTCNNAANVTLSPGQIDRSIDFGYEPQGIIGDTVWIDSDGNGAQNAGEPGIAGVTVELQGNGCTPAVNCPTVETNSSGYYSFGNLPGGNYTVAIVSIMPAGLVLTHDPDQTGINALPPGGTNLDIDFGYRYVGAFSIAGTVFHDDNDNATKEILETQIYPNVTIYLWRGATYIGSMVTDANGDYLFGNLAAGTYTVSLNAGAPNLDGTAPTIIGTPTTFRNATIIASNIIDQDFGVLSSTDFGDLPDSYHTTLSNSGARHTVTSGLYLGTGVTVDNTDTDSNGQVDANAGRLTGGDNGDGNNDEDGVNAIAGNPWGDDGSGQINVTVTGNGCLIGWIDWDDSGTFDAGGTIGSISELLVNQYVTTGANQAITISSPTVANFITDASLIGYNTEMFVRFRLFPTNDPRFASMSVDGNGCPTNASESSMLGLSYGRASGGEVEDYEWLFTSPTAVSMQNIGVNSNSLTAALLMVIIMFAGTALVMFNRNRRRVHIER